MIDGCILVAVALRGKKRRAAPEPSLTADDLYHRYLMEDTCKSYSSARTASVYDMQYSNLRTVMVGEWRVRRCWQREQVLGRCWLC